MKKKLSKSVNKQKTKTKTSSTKKDRKPLIKSKENSSEDIVAFILRDHEPIKKLILILKNSKIGIDKKRPAYKEFEKILLNHAKAEEESLYVHMKKEEGIRLESLEGQVEHLLADQIIKEIDQIHNDDDLWMAKVKVLSELVDHHVQKEEKEILKHVRKDLSLDERLLIGKEYSQLLGQYQTEGNGKVKITEQNNIRATYI